MLAGRWRVPHICTTLAATTDKRVGLQCSACVAACAASLAATLASGGFVSSTLLEQFLRLLFGGNRTRNKRFSTLL
jgi:hypothetical protein